MMKSAETNEIINEQQSADKKILKKTKFFASYRKEIAWLEDMAKQGWIFKNITLGIRYTFEAGEPVHMLYEIDRFNLPKNPTREEILEKDIFMEIATDMGWKEVTHDEAQNYYFCKEYVEGDINELYNDEKSKMERAKKFSTYFLKDSQSYYIWNILIILVTLLLLFVSRFKGESKFISGYIVFVIVYSLFTNVFARFEVYLAKKMEREFMMSREEWEKFKTNDTHKTVKKTIWRIKKLKSFLQQHAKQGWVLTGATERKYFFEKKESTSYIYTMDSQWLTNKRMKERAQEGFSDNKDWMGINNNWQVQSLKDAEAKGWEYVCALQNKAVIYKGIEGTTEPLNDEKYDNKMRFTSMFGKYGVFLIICFVIGMIFGFVCGVLGL